MAKAAASLGGESFRVIHERLMRAYFGENRDITAEATLRAIWKEAGLPESEFARSEACTNAEQAERDLARYLRLAEEEVVSQELLDQFQSRRDAAAAACDGARARVLEAAAALDLARVNLAKTVLRVPACSNVTKL